MKTRTQKIASAEEIAEVQKQLAETFNDPNLTFVTSSHVEQLEDYILEKAFEIYQTTNDLFVTNDMKRLIEMETGKPFEKFIEKRKNAVGKTIDDSEIIW